MRKTFVIGIGLVVLLSACATMTIRWDDLTPHGRAALAMSLYNAEYDAYLVEAASPTLTDAQREVLKVKRKILVEYEAVMKIYAQYVDTGQIPPRELENTLIEQMNKLLMFLSKEG